MCQPFKVTILCLAVFAMQIPRAHADDKTVTEVKNFYRDWEKFENTQEFIKDPKLGLPYIDTKNGRIMDVMEPEEFAGEDFKKHFVEVNTHYPLDSVKFVKMKIRAQGNVAWASYIQITRAKMPGTGNPYEVRVRTIDGLEKIDGKWKIVDESLSLPLDPATMESVMQRKLGSPK
jgi:ketosteroid isomerase-like protein